MPVNDVTPVFPARPDTLTGQVYRQLKQAILTCRLKPGQMLNESEMIQLYGVSKTPVREALKLLTQERLIQSIPGTCYLVTPVTVKDVTEIWEMRAILEEVTATRAARLASDAQLDDLQARVRPPFKVQKIEDLVTWYEQNTAFHLGVAEISGNSRLAASLRRILEEITRMLLLDPEMPEDTGAWVAQHQRILDALRQRDSLLATAVTLEDMNTSRPRIQGVLFTN